MSSSQGILELGLMANALDEASSCDTYDAVRVYYGTDDSSYAIYPSTATSTDSFFDVDCYSVSASVASTIAYDIYTKISSMEYQGFAATNAYADLAYELGDGVDVGTTYGGLYEQTIYADSLGACDISAPFDSDLEHEYKYDDTSTMEIRRVNSKIDTNFTVLDGRISSKISSSEAQSLIDQTLDTITLSVSDSSGSTTFVIKAGSTTLDTETADIHVKQLNIEGLITASQIDVTDLVVSNANITNLNASKLIVNGQSIGTSSTRLDAVYADTGAFTYGLFNAGGYLTFAETSGYNVTLSSSGASAVTSSGTVSSTWANIIAGGSGTAKWG